MWIFEETFDYNTQEEFRYFVAKTILKNTYGEVKISILKLTNLNFQSYKNIFHNDEYEINIQRKNLIYVFIPYFSDTKK